MREIDTDEKRITCQECNGYLWSVSRYESVAELVPCPYVKDSSGQCTGIRPNKGKANAK